MLLKNQQYVIYYMIEDIRLNMIEEINFIYIYICIYYNSDSYFV